MNRTQGGPGQRLPAPESFPSSGPNLHHTPTPGAVATPVVGAEQLGAWQVRARWLEREAASRSEPRLRARLLLAASEVRALLGETRTALRLAQQAEQLEPEHPWHTRQVRALAQRAGDFQAVVSRLRDEAAQAPSPASAAHSLYVCSQVLRVYQRDGAGAQSCLEQARARDPDDSRLAVQALLPRLVSSGDAEATSGTSTSSTSRLERAAKNALAMRRGQFDPANAADAPSSATRPTHELETAGREGAPAPAAAKELELLSVVSAVETQRWSDASRLLQRLCEGTPLAGPSLWLSGLWLSAQRSTLAEAVLVLQSLVRAHPGALERRFLAAKALQQRSTEALLEALAEPGGGENSGATTFSALEETCCRSLAGLALKLPAPGDMSPEVLDLLRPLLRAVRALPLQDDPAEPSRSEALFELGWQLQAQTQSAVVLSELGVLGSDAPWAIVWRLEHHRERGDLANVGKDLPQLLANQKSAQADGHFLSGLLLERTGERELARAHYQHSLLSRVSREPAVRALLDTLPAGEQAHMLRSLSVQTTGRRRALLLTEALYRLGMDAAEYEALADEALRSDPELPFALQLAERAAFRRRDPARRSRWVQQRRQLSTSLEEKGIETAREALCLAQQGNRLAVQRLNDFARSHPVDWSFWQLLESLTDLPPEARATLRLELGSRSPERLREYLLADAMQFAGRAGQWDLARQAALGLSSAWGRLQQEHLPLSEEELGKLEGTSEALEPAQRINVLERLTRVCLSQGKTERAMRYQLALLELDRHRLGTLRDLERLGAQNLKSDALLGAVQGLLDELEPSDALPYTLVVAKLRALRGQPELTPASVHRLLTLPALPAWALWLFIRHGERTGDDTTLLAALKQLQAAPPSALDRVVLCLRGAEAAMRLKDWAEARAQVDRAVEIAPSNVVGLSLRAEILQAQTDYPEAAKAYEMVAQVAKLRERKAEVLATAGSLWLETLGDPERGARDLEQAARLAPGSDEVFERLLKLYEANKAHDRIYELVSLRRAGARSLEDQTRLQRTQADALRRIGRPAEARELVVALLARDPGDARARDLLARTYLDERAYDRAEATWVELLAAEPENAVALEALRGLSDIYHTQGAATDKAMDVCRRILSLDPDDKQSLRRLIQHTSQREAHSEAAALQARLWELASSDEERRQLTLEWVALLGRVPGAAGRAKQLLTHARTTWPESTELLRAEIHFYRDSGDQEGTRGVIQAELTRSRAALASGKLQPSLLRTLDVAARAAGEGEVSRMAQAVVGALQGVSVGVEGAGATSLLLQQQLAIAPQPLGGPLGRLLIEHGEALDQAYAVPSAARDAVALDDLRARQVRQVAAAFGLATLRVDVSRTLGCQCLPARWPEPGVVFGQGLLQYPNPRVRDFLLLVALATLQTHTCALVGQPEHQARAAIAGLAGALGVAVQPPEVQAEQVEQARAKIAAKLTAPASAAVRALAEAANDQAQVSVERLTEGCLDWAKRLALLGVGEPAVALESLWVESHPHLPLPTTVEERSHWLTTRADAVRLLAYAVSDQHARARQALR